MQFCNLAHLEEESRDVRHYSGDRGTDVCHLVHQVKSTPINSYSLRRFNAVLIVQFIEASAQIWIVKQYRK